MPWFKMPETCCHGMMIDVDKETHSKYQKIKIEGIKNVANLQKKIIQLINSFHLLS